MSNSDTFITASIVIDENGLAKPVRSAKVRVSTALVSPSDLEIAWETDDQGSTYIWTNVKHNAPFIPQVLEFSATSFDAGVREAQAIVDQHAAFRGRFIPVAQVNVTEDGGMSFTATAMIPAADLKV